MPGKAGITWKMLFRVWKEILLCPYPWRSRSGRSAVVFIMGVLLFGLALTVLAEMWQAGGSAPLWGVALLLNGMSLLAVFSMPWLNPPVFASLSPTLAAHIQESHPGLYGSYVVREALPHHFERHFLKLVEMDAARAADVLEQVSRQKLDRLSPETARKLLHTPEPTLRQWGLRLLGRCADGEESQ